mmetsp:Transcript_18130/g.20515  ORF Transcript_18130/g.20515 Transcript_18130/m.20515 type:complete len:87 (+) Transcript_18130:387-647(+)
MTSTTSNNMSDQRNISNAKIVYLVAVSGCGKSFTGDYLHSMHGYSHIDGDGPIKNCHIPRNRELSLDFQKNIFAMLILILILIAHG